MGLDRQYLAKQAGGSQQLIGHYENGIKAPKLEKAILPAKALGVPVEATHGQLEKRKRGEAKPHTHRNSRVIKMQEVFKRLSPEK